MVSPHARRLAIAAAAVAAIWLGTSCGGDTAAPSSPPPPPAVGSVHLDSASFTIIVGSTRQLVATVLSTTGAALAGRTVSWSSADAAVATVSASGLVTGARVGTTTITASSDGQSATATITVVPVPIATLTITPANANVYVGHSARFIASAKDSAGNALSPASIGWTSSNSSVATVLDSGVATGIAPGTTTVTATAQGVSASAALVVVAQTVFPLTVPASSVAADGPFVAYVSGGLPDTTYAISFDTVHAVGRRIDDSTIAAIVPPSIHGPVAVHLDLGARLGTATLTVGTPVVVNDAASAITGSLQQVATALTPAPGGYPAASWTADSTKLAAAVAAARSAAATLPAADQQMVAAELTALAGEGWTADLLPARAASAAATSADCSTRVATEKSELALLRRDAEQVGAFAAAPRVVLQPVVMLHAVKLAASAAALSLACGRLDSLSAVTSADAGGVDVEVHGRRRAWINADTLASVTVRDVAHTYVRAATVYALLRSLGMTTPGDPALAPAGASGGVTVPTGQIDVTNLRADGGVQVTATAATDTSILVRAATALVAPAGFTATLVVHDQDFPLLSAAASGTLPVVPARIVAYPDTLRLGAGSAGVVAVYALRADGATLNVPIAWSSSDTSVATVVGGTAPDVTSRGTVSAKRVGTAIVTAAYGGVSENILVIVAPSAVAQVRDIVSVPSLITVEPGTTLHMQTMAVDSTYGVIPQAGYAPYLSWSSSDPAVARIDNAGSFTAVAPGSARLTVSINGLSRYAYATVMHFDAGTPGNWDGSYILESYNGTTTPAWLDASREVESGAATIWPSGYYELGATEVVKLGGLNVVAEAGHWSVTGGVLHLHSEGGVSGYPTPPPHDAAATTVATGRFTVTEPYFLGPGNVDVGFRRTSAAPPPPVRPFSAYYASYAAAVTTSDTGSSTKIHVSLTVGNADVIARTLSFQSSCRLFMWITKDSTRGSRELATDVDGPSCSVAKPVVDTVAAGGQKLYSDDRGVNVSPWDPGSTPLAAGRYFVWAVVEWKDSTNMYPAGWITISP